jgi:hypothetical protein
MTDRVTTRATLALRSLVLAIGLVGLLVPSVLAHPGGPEQVIVAGDHVNPGEAFQLLASSIEADVDVPVTVVTGSSTFDLGNVRVSSDGQIDTMLMLPATVPLGYAELHLAQPTQGDAATIFLVGPREDGVASTGARTPLDTQAGALLLFVGTLAGIAVVAFLLLRGGRRHPA